MELVLWLVIKPPTRNLRKTIPSKIQMSTKKLVMKMRLSLERRTYINMARMLIVTRKRKSRAKPTKPTKILTKMTSSLEKKSRRTKPIVTRKRKSRAKPMKTTKILTKMTSSLERRPKRTIPRMHILTRKSLARRTKRTMRMPILTRKSIEKNKEDDDEDAYEKDDVEEINSTTDGEVDKEDEEGSNTGKQNDNKEDAQDGDKDNNKKSVADHKRKYKYGLDKYFRGKEAVSTKKKVTTNKDSLKIDEKDSKNKTREAQVKKDVPDPELSTTKKKKEKKLKESVALKKGQEKDIFHSKNR
mmetsp:Transcript_19302/g.28320  ORF Transcript_19302/g.28320 Transcript_19302/m.28320 type:complete len:300 (+) Transcript_19302:659-1558(+)